jgi:hypothetical protein
VRLGHVCGRGGRRQAAVLYNEFAVTMRLHLYLIRWRRS